MFTLHGTIMVFLFIIPAIPAIIGNFVLPIMLGAKDVAFPRLNLASFWVWALGACFFLWVLLGGVVTTIVKINLAPAAFTAWRDSWGWVFPFGLDTGWVFYTPYSTTKSTTGVIPATLGAFILGFSSILTGLNFIASVHMLRPKGMTWFRMPLLLWGLYSTAIIQILATPVLAITLLLLIAERALGIGIFDPTLGGDPILYQHFFWFYSHPAVYIMVLPALGVTSEIIGVMCRRHIFGYNFIALLVQRRHRLLQLHRVGPPHVRQRPERAGQRDLQPADLQRRHPVGGQGLQLGRHHVEGQHQPRHADALRHAGDLRLPRRRADRPVPRGACRPTSTSTTPTSSSPTSTTS